MRKEKIKRAEEIKKEIIQKYDKQPEGWYAFVGRDSENYLQSLFIKNDKLWIIKEFPVNPYKTIGVGVKRISEKEEVKKFKNKLEFGLRPIITEQIECLLRGDYSVITEILKNQPLSSEKCHSFPAILGGPFSMFSEREFISKKQKKLDMKLRKKLRELIYREHPEIILSYR